MATEDTLQAPAESAGHTFAPIRFVRVPELPVTRTPPTVPVVLVAGTCWVVLHHLALYIDAQQPQTRQLERLAREWADEFAAAQEIVAPHWVAGFDVAPVPCLRWPFLRALLAQWRPRNPSDWQQRLMDALEGAPDQTAADDIPPRARRAPSRVDGAMVRQIYTLMTEQGMTAAEIARTINFSASGINRIAAGNYPFSTLDASDAWRDSFGQRKHSANN